MTLVKENKMDDEEKVNIEPEHIAAFASELGAIQYYLFGHGAEWTDEEALRVYGHLRERHGADAIKELEVEEMARWMIEWAAETE
jgi:hypothetical protein